MIVSQQLVCGVNVILGFDNSYMELLLAKMVEFLGM